MLERRRGENKRKGNRERPSERIIAQVCDSHTCLVNILTAKKHINSQTDWVFKKTGRQIARQMNRKRWQMYREREKKMKPEREKE